jgi:hypothetical protein
MNCISCELGKSKEMHIEPTGAPKLFSLFFSFFLFVGLSVYCELGRGGGRTDGADGADGRAMPGLRSWMDPSFVGADTQSGQINFTARRNNVIGGVRLEMSA